MNALALVAAHPGDVRTLVAHEPPLASILPDREGAMAVTEAIHDTYQRSGFGAGDGALHRRREPQGADRPRSSRPSPAPDPAMFGMPAGDDGTRTDALLGQNIITCTHYEPDFEALRAASTRIVLAAGVESDGEMAHRGAEAAAERLGTTPVVFPSGHGGFLGGEYGQTGEPDAFAATLREVLAGVAPRSSSRHPAPDPTCPWARPGPAHPIQARGVRERLVRSPTHTRTVALDNDPARTPEDDPCAP